MYYVAQIHLMFWVAYLLPQVSGLILTRNQIDDSASSSFSEICFLWRELASVTACLIHFFRVRDLYFRYNSCDDEP